MIKYIVGRNIYAKFIDILARYLEKKERRRIGPN
jgi:hypothetical protein